MQTATITIKYVNAPKGRGPASVKDSNGVYWKFWTRDIPMDRFSVGNSYTVGYKNEPYDGKDQYIIQEVLEGGAPAAPAPAPRQSAPAPAQNGPSNGNGQRDEFIFVCGLINQGVASGKINPFETTSVADAIAVAREAYRQTFGKAA
jgi:hypothetical protein